MSAWASGREGGSRDAGLGHNARRRRWRDAARFLDSGLGAEGDSGERQAKKKQGGKGTNGGRMLQLGGEYDRRRRAGMAIATGIRERGTGGREAQRRKVDSAVELTVAAPVDERTILKWLRSWGGANSRATGMRCRAASAVRRNRGTAKNP